MNENFKQGVAALKAGDRTAARRLLGTAVRESPEEPQAWLWLSGAVDRDEERIYCLRQVLQLDPNNEIASRGLNQILARWSNPKPERSASTSQEKSQPATVTAVEPEGGQPIKNEGEKSSSTVIPPDILQEQAATQGSLAADSQPVSPNRRFSIQPGSDLSGNPVFKIRPSLAHVLIGFWAMFVLLWIMNGVLQESTQTELSLSFLTCGILGAFTAYLIFSISFTRYELTTRQLTISTLGQQTIIPVQHIIRVDLHQNRLQKMLKTGDILVEASVAGELKQIRLHNVSDLKNRMDQIQYLIPE